MVKVQLATFVGVNILTVKEYSRLSHVVQYYLIIILKYLKAYSNLLQGSETGQAYKKARLID